MNIRDVKEDRLGKYYSSLPAGFRVAMRSDFIPAKTGTPYLLLSEIDMRYRCFRVGDNFPIDGFWDNLKKQQIFVLK